MILVLAIVAAEYAFYGVLSPTAWGHNYLEPLPFIAIVAAIGVQLLSKRRATRRNGGNSLPAVRP